MGLVGRDRATQEAESTTCGKTFPVNYGAPFYGIKFERDKIIDALKIVKRGGMRGVARAMGVDKDSICARAKKASEHAKAFTARMLHDLHMTAVEVDELWTTAKKAGAHRERERGPGRARRRLVWKAEGLPFRLRVPSVVERGSRMTPPNSSRR